MDKILLNKARSFNSFNKEQNASLELKQSARLLPFNQIKETLDKYQLYIEERDNCDKYRLVFNINPICSNVLFNMRTEMVLNEGSDNCKALVTDSNTISTMDYAVNKSILNRQQGIKDTEYSHPNIGPLVYHCGIDIFNNHRLRSDDFIHINKVATGVENKYYNTLWDLKRDRYGNPIEEIPMDIASSTTTSAKINPHVYQIENVKSFSDAVGDNLYMKNGWFGFTNQASIDIPNGSTETMVINKIMCNNKACEIYHLYPDISLFSFSPKYNKHRKRMEKNWDYCLTYPYKSDADKFNEVNKNTIGGIGVAYTSEGKSDSGEDIIVVTSIIKHSLKRDSVVKFYWGNDKKNGSIIRIVGLGDLTNNNKDRCFKVLKEDISSILNKNNICFKRISGGIPCKYYFRKFKKINENDFANENSKMSYGENIYGDSLSQIIYTDTINLNGYKDNLGRNLSEIYLTIVKRNTGYNKWRGGTYSGSDIEFSHCFGKVDSGLNIEDSGIVDYNIHKIHNINVNNHEILGTINGSSIKRLESDLTVGASEFYGDIVELDINNYMETTLENVYHRFNTEQRESDRDSVTIYELVNDDYGILDNDEFKIDEISIPMGRQPEGYYYKPHYKIQLHSLSNDTESYLGKKITGANERIETEERIFGDDKEICYFLYIDSEEVYNYIKGDVFGVYDYTKDKLFWGILDEIIYTWDPNKGRNNIQLKIELFGDNISSIKVDNIDVCLTDGTVPLFSLYDPTKQSFYWRDVKANSEESTTSELYNIPFTNGAHYYQTNINFYLKRQDPFGEYGLNYDNFMERASKDEKIDETKRLILKGIKTAFSLKNVWKGIKIQLKNFKFFESINESCI